MMFIFKLFLIALLACVLEVETGKAAEGSDAKDGTIEQAKIDSFRKLSSSGGSGGAHVKGKDQGKGDRARDENIGKVSMGKLLSGLGSNCGVVIENEDLQQCIGGCLTRQYGENPDQGKEKKAGPEKPAAIEREETGGKGERRT